jgi:DNA-binding transcriptional MerR regulator
MGTMKVGEVAERTGVSVRSIRHYERAGLLTATRKPNGYREFDGTAVERVRAIRHLLETGFTVEEVLSLSGCLMGAAPDTNCGERTLALYRDKVAKIEQQMRTLQQLKQRIEERICTLEPC